MPELDPLLLGGLLLGLLLLGLVVLPEELPPLELGDELDELSLLPLAPPVAPELEPDLKCASHSLREIWPSLLVSTVVKLGVEAEAPPAALPPLDMPEPPLELLLGEELLPPLALLGEELLPLDAPDEPLLPVVALGDLSLLEAPLEDEPELCAMETLASAKSAAAVAVVISFNFIW